MGDPSELSGPSDAPAADSVDRHVALWSKELDWMDPVKEAIFARLAILARHAAQARRDTLDSDGLRHWQFKVLLMLRRIGPPYEASPSRLAAYGYGSPTPESVCSSSTRRWRKRVRTRCSQC
jgi:hypothetical protein